MSQMVDRLQAALDAFSAVQQRVNAGIPVTIAEYNNAKAAVIVRAGMCARWCEGGEGAEVRAVARKVVDCAHPDERVSVWGNPYACGAIGCILRPHGAAPVVGPPHCQCLDEHLPDADRARVRRGVRWLAQWAGRVRPDVHETQGEMATPIPGDIIVKAGASDAPTCEHGNRSYCGWCGVVK